MQSVSLVLCYALAKQASCYFNPSLKKRFSKNLQRSDMHRIIIVSLHFNSHLGNAEAKDRGDMFSCQH